MESDRLDHLLLRSGLLLHWSEESHLWWFSTIKSQRGSEESQSGHPAANQEEAMAAAMQMLEDLNLPSSAPSHHSILLDKLLNKYRLTFNWANPGLRWWLVGQNKGSNTLRRTTPRSSKDIDTAKADAVIYILNSFRPVYGVEAS